MKNKNIRNSSFQNLLEQDSETIETLQQDFYNGNFAEYNGYQGMKEIFERLFEKYEVQVIKSTNHNQPLRISIPTRATKGSAGIDLRAAIDNKLIVKAGKISIVPTGLSFNLPEGMELQIRSRSGLAAKYGLVVLNQPGTLDADFTGQVQILLINHGEDDFIINRGDRIAQAVFNHIALPSLIEVDTLYETERGTRGFGSSGISS